MCREGCHSASNASVVNGTNSTELNLTSFWVYDATVNESTVSNSTNSTNATDVTYCYGGYNDGLKKGTLLRHTII
jgi:hypothetical protein